MKNIHLIVISFICLIPLYGQSYINEDTPQRIILNLTESPSTSIAVTWRTISEVDTPIVQYAKATGGTKFTEETDTCFATTQPFQINDSINVYHYSGIIENLLPGVKYVYRVGSTNAWSEWNQFATAFDNPTPFEFVYFGDPQNKIKSYCSRIFRTAFQASPNAAFWLFAGDLVTDPKDELWDEFFYAGGFIFGITPSIMAAGNHDHILKTIDGKKTRTDKISPIWNAHFTLPENGLEDLKELSYYVDYQGVRMIVLESQTKLQEQAEWLDMLLASNSNLWTIVSFHHPLFSTGRDRQNSQMQKAFLEIFDKYNVDLVLQGHDHVYGRTHKLFDKSIVDDNQKGTVYVVSMSGPKFYGVKSISKDIMAKMGGELQFFQTIKIDGGKLSFKAFTATGELFDSFELHKN